MLYPIVYDALETNFDTYGLGVIEHAYELRVFQRLNSDNVCTFSMPRDDDKFDLLDEERIVKVDGQLYIIRSIEEYRDDQGGLYASVECEHVFFELLGTWLDNLSLVATSPSTALATILSGTRFTGDATAVTGTINVTAQQKTAVYGINQILTAATCEIARDNFSVTLLPQIGANNGVQIRYRKNLKSIKRKKDTRGVITRLWVYGKDGVKVGPIDSPNIGLYPTPKEGSVTFKDETDPAVLTSKGTAYLATVDTPKVSYDVSLVELKALAEYGDAETIKEGDTVLVVDEDLGINVTARVVEYEEYKLEPWRSRVMLANFLPGIEDYNALLADTRNTVQTFTSQRGGISTTWLDGIIDTLVNQLKASGSYTTAQVLDDKGFLLENTDDTSPDYGALYLGPGIFAIASAKNPDGSWNWRTFGKGTGFTADLLNVGQIQTSFIKITGDTNFYWDQQNIYMVDPADVNKQIRIGKYDGTNYGVAFTTDGGSSWTNALDFTGLTIGPSTTYAAGYDPSTKATPADVAAAQTAADNAQSTANAAQSTANSSVQQNTFYNRVRITPTGGIEVLDASNNQRVHIGDLGSDKYGIEIKTPTGDVSLETDSNGEINLTKGQISITHANGSQTVIDGSAFKVYPSAADTTNYIGVDSQGMFRDFNGTISRFVEAFTVGNGSSPGDGYENNQGGSDASSFYKIYTQQNIDLIGAQWVNKASLAKVQLTSTSIGSTQDTTLTQLQTVLEVASISNLSNGIRITVNAGATFYRFDGLSGGIYSWTWEKVNIDYSYVVIA